MVRGPQCGFTLIEILTAVAVLGVLAIVAVPLFSDLTRAAHRASVERAAVTFRSAVTMVQLAYRAKGVSGPGANDNVVGFGNGTVDVNAAGHPTGAGDNNTIGNQRHCVDIWNAILSSPPSISRLNQGAIQSDYKAQRAGQTCKYIYQADAAVPRDFVYNANTGAVTLNNP